MGTVVLFSVSNVFFFFLLPAIMPSFVSPTMLWLEDFLETEPETEAGYIRFRHEEVEIRDRAGRVLAKKINRIDNDDPEQPYQNRLT